MTGQADDQSRGNGAAPVASDAAPDLAPVMPGKVKRAPRRTARKRGADTPPAAAAPDRRAPEFYLNRELTWLDFNRRVLAEAKDPNTPLLERVKFLAIVGSNLDEFFMKRIGGLKQQLGAGVQDLTVDGRTPQRQIEECTAVIHEMHGEKRSVYLALIDELAANGIALVDHDALTDDERAAMRADYLENIFPLVTPLAMDPAHPFPFLSNLSLNLLVVLHYPDEPEIVMARVKVPVGSGVPRFLPVGGNGVGESGRFILLEEVMANNLDLLFPGMKVESCELFRVTRNANTERDEDQADDLLALIESEVRDRKFAPIVRLQTAAGIDPAHRGMLAAELGLDEARDIYEIDVMVGMAALMELATLDIPALRDPPHHPIDNVKLQDGRNIFHIIREMGPILLHHPYESFATSVERFVREASTDPKVLAIKMTLYRTSAGTRIIDYLVDAARNGKQVAVVVELKARFDETANIQWASRLEEVGVHVTYGVLGLKTHAKAILVVRKDYSGLRRYAHIGTGNYHAESARLYCDFGLLSCDDDIGKDLTELFNYLTTGCKPSRKYRKILVAPKLLKKALLAKIDREIAGHSKESPGLIRIKANAIEDADITEALYRASGAGVTVQLILRDTCRLRPGIPGVSENITVISIVGRFLEHGRLYYFRNGGAEGGGEEFFIGSADLMTRNLESRVEALVPVEDEALRNELRGVFDMQLADGHNAWDMLPDGRYVARRGPARGGKRGDGEAAGCQHALIGSAERRNFEANRLRKRKPRVLSRRTPR